MSASVWNKRHWFSLPAATVGRASVPAPEVGRASVPARSDARTKHAGRDARTTLQSGPVPHKRSRPRPGFSIVETILSSLLVGVVLTAALSAVTSTYMSQQQIADRARGLQLIDDMAAELFDKPYCGPGDVCSTRGPSGDDVATNRAGTFDDIDDYGGLVDSPIRDGAGAAPSGWTGWTRRVTCDWVQPNNWNQTRGTDGGVKRLTIKVDNGKGVVLSSTFYRTSCWNEIEPMERAP